MSWRYTCSIPLWINGKDEAGEPVVVSPDSRATYLSISTRVGDFYLQMGLAEQWLQRAILRARSSTE